MSDALSSPLGHAKRQGRALPVSGPFPQPLTDAPRSVLGSTARWFFVSGELRGSQVVVRKSGDVALLTNMGFFGIDLRQKENHKVTDQNEASSEFGDSEEEKEGEGLEFWQTSESSDTDEVPDAKRPRLDPDPLEPERQLVLSSYEAFFLVHSVSMLRVFSSEDPRTEPLSILELWNLFRSRIRVFPFHYAVYLFYRAKGWVPKHGLRVGADFTLYPQGPPYFHAVFSVRVQVLRSDTLTCLDLTGNTPLNSLRDLMTLHRVSHKIDKKLVLCYVVVPESLRDTTSPAVLSALRVKEVFVERYRPSATAATSP